MKKLQKKIRLLLLGSLLATAVAVGGIAFSRAWVHIKEASQETQEVISAQYSQKISQTLETFSGETDSESANTAYRLFDSIRDWTPTISEADSKNQRTALFGECTLTILAVYIIAALFCLWTTERFFSGEKKAAQPAARALGEDVSAASGNAEAMPDLKPAVVPGSKPSAAVRQGVESSLRNEGILEDALKMLLIVYHKILKINLTEDTFYEIKAYETELNSAKGYSNKISEWLREFALSGQVHEEDREGYLAFADIEELKRRLSAGETWLAYRYRRKVGEKFRWVKMEIVASVEYSEENQVAILYVRDIHDSYTSELDHQKNLEKLNNTDSLTGLYNRLYLTRFCREYVQGEKKNVGLLFCDLNGLKYTNDHFGHNMGDKLILDFARLLKSSFPNNLCFRMSGDEFVVIVLDESKENFEKKLVAFREAGVRPENGFPLASIGACFHEKAENIGSMLPEAEKEMYAQKKLFYKDHPTFRR